MNGSNLWRHKGLALAVAVCFFLTAPVPASAGTFPQITEVTVLEIVGIIQTTMLDFGRIQRPTSSAVAFALSTDGSEATGGGGGAFIDGQQVGQLTVSGTDSQSYSISATPGLCGLTGVTFDFVLLSKLSGTFTSGSDTVLVGGQLIITNTAPGGSGTCAYSVNADY